MVAIVRTWTPKERLADMEMNGKQSGIMAGTHIDNLVATGKAIWLCWSCSKKFNPLSVNYGQRSNLPKAKGYCDACKAVGTHKVYIPNSITY